MGAGGHQPGPRGLQVRRHVGPPGPPVVGHGVGRGQVPHRPLDGRHAHGHGAALPVRPCQGQEPRHLRSREDGRREAGAHLRGRGAGLHAALPSCVLPAGREPASGRRGRVRGRRGGRRGGGRERGSVQEGARRHQGRLGSAALHPGPARGRQARRAHPASGNEPRFQHDRQHVRRGRGMGARVRGGRSPTGRTIRGAIPTARRCAT